MRVELIKLGKPAHSEYEALVNKFQERLSRFVKVDSQIHKSTQDREKDSRNILKIINDGPRRHLILCDERGRDCSTAELCDLFRAAALDPAIQNICFIIGGPFGVNENVRKAADRCVRLSAGVLPSDLAWLVLNEQIYRAFSILNNSNYHHA